MAVLTCVLGPDAAGTLLTELLETARERLDCAMYEVGPAYRWAFERAAAHDVAVRVLLDAHPGDGNAASAVGVVTAGGDCRVLTSGAGRGHWKLVICDADRVAVGTGNLLWRDAPRDARHRLPPEAPPVRGTREWWALVAGAPRLAEQALAQFEGAWRVSVPPPAAWAAAAIARPVGAPVPEVAPMRVELDEGLLELVVGGPAIARRIAGLLAGARYRALVTAPYVHCGSAAVRPLLEAMAHVQGQADVRLLLGAPPAPRDVLPLRDLGVPAAVMEPSRSTLGHAKGVVVDGTAVVSSANWSGAGFSSSWEAALVCRHLEAADFYAAALLRDWGSASPVVSRARVQGKLELE